LVPWAVRSGTDHSKPIALLFKEDDEDFKRKYFSNPVLDH
jgi:hypothetical protein